MSDEFTPVEYEAAIEDYGRRHRMLLEDLTSLQSYVWGLIDRVRYYGDPLTIDQLEYIHKEIKDLRKTYDWPESP